MLVRKKNELKVRKVTISKEAQYLLKVIIVNYHFIAIISTVLTFNPLFKFVLE